MVGHVGRIVAHKEPIRPFQLLVDGDLLSLKKCRFCIGVLILLLSPR